MKKILTFLFALAITFNTYGQLEVLDSAGTVTYNDGDTLQLTPEQAFYVNVHNAGTDTVNLICLADEVILQSGTSAEFNVCANNVCATVTEPGQIGNEIALAPDSLSTADALYLPMGADSSAFLALKFVDRDNPDDAVTLYFLYDANSGAVLNSVESNESITLYPMPANDLMTVNYDVEKVSNIEIFDFNGKKIQTIPVQEAKGSIFMNTAYLSDGVYFLKIGDVAKKFVVKH